MSPNKFIVIGLSALITSLMMAEESPTVAGFGIVMGLTMIAIAAGLSSYNDRFHADFKKKKERKQ